MSNRILDAGVTRGFAKKDDGRNEYIPISLALSKQILARVLFELEPATANPNQLQRKEFPFIVEIDGSLAQEDILSLQLYFATLGTQIVKVVEKLKLRPFEPEEIEDLRVEKMLSDVLSDEILKYRNPNEVPELSDAQKRQLAILKKFLSMVIVKLRLGSEMDLAAQQIQTYADVTKCQHRVAETIRVKKIRVEDYDDNLLNQKFSELFAFFDNLENLPKPPATA